MDIPSPPLVPFNSGQDIQAAPDPNLPNHFLGGSRRPRGRATKKQNPWNENSITFLAHQPPGALNNLVDSSQTIPLPPSPITPGLASFRGEWQGLGQL